MDVSRSLVRPRLVGLVAVTLLILLAACSTGRSSAAGPSGSRLQVVAAEGFWGSIAGQLGGDHVEVASIVTNPATDPHDYEPTPDDGRTFAQAQYVVVNGVGYDPWATKLIDANPVDGRRVLDVGHLVGAAAGDNPHRWYVPGDVERVVDQITSDYQRLDPAAADAYQQRHDEFEATGLARYHALLAQVRDSYSGTPVGASESIFEGLAAATGLDLLSPASYLGAISEGTEPTAADKATMDRQIADGEIKVFVFNSQNSTPDVQRLVEDARQAHIPVVTVTETLTPANATFQDCLLYTSPSPRDRQKSRMPSSA